MRNELDKLRKEEAILLERLEKINAAIKAFQNVCTHKHPDGSDAMEYDGHDSHKDYYKCQICGYEDWG